MESERLIGVRAKIERAKHHIRNLDAGLSDFAKKNRDCVVRERNPDTDEIIHRVRFVLPIPGDAPLIIGDTAHNLRSALDHLAWQLVEAGGTHKPTTKTMYPIYETVEKYVAKPPGKIKGIAVGAQNLIESTQPYHAGYEAMGALTELDNFDKHRLLIVAAARPSAMGMVFDLGGAKIVLGLGAVPGSPIPDIRCSLTGGPELLFLEDGAVIGRIMPAHEYDEKTHPYLAPIVVFREPGILERKPVLEFLSQTTRLVESIVSQFERFL